MPGELHGLESLQRLPEQCRIVAGDAEAAERERLGEGARLQPVRCFCFDAVAVAERGEGVQEGRSRLPVPVQPVRGEFRELAGPVPGQGQADLRTR